MTNKEEIRRLVQKYTDKGLMRKPKPQTAVDPADTHFIRDLKRRGESNSRIADILHVTDEALKKTLDAMNLS
jgi:predicted transcriptional regulator